MAPQLAHTNPEWDDLEDAAIAFRGISSMILALLNEVEPNTNEYHALEGVAILADVKWQQLQQLTRPE